jgi:uncharacterized membrane protein
VWDVVRERAGAVAYIGGSLGTPIGGDLLHLRGLRDLGAGVASIGRRRHV